MIGQEPKNGDASGKKKIAPTQRIQYPVVFAAKFELKMREILITDIYIYIYIYIYIVVLDISTMAHNWF